MFDALQLLGYYALILVILGTIGNAIILYVSFRIKASSIFVLFRYLAICDTLALYFWNLNIFTYSVLNLDLQNYNMNSCKFGNWIQFSSLQSSAWILVNNKLHFQILIINFRFFRKIVQHISRSVLKLYYSTAREFKSGIFDL